MLLEMARVGDMDSKLAIYIRSNDPGNIPHFHIVDQVTMGDKFHTCIKIETAEYFHHTGKEDILNAVQVNADNEREYYVDKRTAYRYKK